MATTADIKIGACIELEGKTFQIVDFQHVKPGKGPAFVRTKLKNLENGRVLDNTFSAGAKVEFVRVERRPYQFTYEDDLGAHFMLNVGGVSALLPLTGVPLLFISDGGSALVSAFITMGLCQHVIAKINTTELAEKQ